MMFPLIMNLALVCIKRNFLASLIFTVTTFECQLLNTLLLKQKVLVHTASRAVDLLPRRPDRAYVASRIRNMLEVTLKCFSHFSFRFINIVFFICHWLAMSNSCYNPIIYGVFSVSDGARLKDGP